MLYRDNKINCIIIAAILNLIFSSFIFAGKKIHIKNISPEVQKVAEHNLFDVTSYKQSKTSSISTNFSFKGREHVVSSTLNPVDRTVNINTTVFTADYQSYEKHTSQVILPSLPNDYSWYETYINNNNDILFLTLEFEKSGPNFEDHSFNYTSTDGVNWHPYTMDPTGELKLEYIDKVMLKVKMVS